MRLIQNFIAFLLGVAIESFVLYITGYIATYGMFTSVALFYFAIQLPISIPIIITILLWFMLIDKKQFSIYFGVGSLVTLIFIISWNLYFLYN